MSLRHAVLGLLDSRPGSGYDLLQTFRGSLQNIWPATQSQLYGELARLTDDGQASVTEVGPRGRKEYALTDAGREELRRWMLEAPGESFRRNDLMLRVFLLDSVTPREARNILEHHAAVMAQRHDELLAQQAQLHSASPRPGPGALVLEWAVRMTAMQRDWAMWAQSELGRVRRRH